MRGRQEPNMFLLTKFRVAKIIKRPARYLSMHSDTHRSLPVDANQSGRPQIPNDP